MNFKYALLLLTVFMIILIPETAYAQVPPPTPVPIDGVSEVLMIAGAAYVVRKIKKARNKGKEEG